MVGPLGSARGSPLVERVGWEEGDFLGMKERAGEEEDQKANHGGCDFSEAINYGDPKKKRIRFN